tara:strand:+ start:323 stop:568 length:246 start_codon:yes stop_codon:yes gene_type:complete
MEISKENREIIVRDIQEYFKNELDQEIGNFDAGFLLDFFAENVGGFFYNQALTDVNTLMREKTEAITDGLYELIKPTPGDN